MPSKGLKDVEFQKPISDEDVTIDQPEISDSDVVIDSGSKLVNETSPDVSWWSRFAIKNFGSPEGGVEYLKEKYPDYNVTQEGGDIFLEKGGKKYPLDPKGFDAADITDIGTDTGAGILSTAAAGAGGLVGNIPGAMAAGGASSGVLESLKQAIGMGLGVQKEFDPTSVGISTALGGVTPLVFGGAGAGTVAKEAAKRKLSEEAADQLLKSQRGVVERTWDSAIPFLSNIGKDKVEYLKKNLPKLINLESKQYPTTELAKKAKAGFEQIDEIAKVAGKEGEILRNQFQGSIPTAPAKQPFLDEIARIESFQNPSDAEKKTLSELKNALSTYFPSKKVEAAPAEVGGLLDEFGKPIVTKPAVSASEIPVESISAPQSFSTRQLLKEYANPMKEYRSGATENAAKIAEQKFAEQEKNLIPGAKEYAEKYADISALNEWLGPKASIEDRALDFVKGAAKKGKSYNWELLEKLDKKYGTDFLDTAKMSNVFETFGKSRPGQLLQDAVRQRVRAEVIGAALGGYLGNKSGIGFGAGAGLGAGLGFMGASPSAVRFYLNATNKMAPASSWLKLGVQPSLNMANEYLREK